ncbi:MAG TPA: SDR family oxidoreductase [Gemmatimonadaceae bacterium]|nr:SDR family oxidoreductase [Gemmatimonadaceae bacterium]
MPPRTASAAAIVTGHSRGLGAAMAAELLARRVPVLGISRGDNSELRASHPADLMEVKLDLSDMGALKRWTDAPALADFVRDVKRPLLINNAGLLEPMGPMSTQDMEDVGRTVAVNVGAVLMMSVAFVQATTASDDRRILQISSGAGRKAYAGWSVYCATKAALDHHARCIALDRTPGLRISSVAPGVIDTDMQALIRGSTDASFPDRPRFVAMHREGKLRNAQQVARAIVEFLLSDEFGREPVHEMAY